MCWGLRKRYWWEKCAREIKEEEPSWLFISPGFSLYSEKEAVSDPGYNIWFFSYYWCGSLMGETVFSISRMLLRAFILLKKYWRSCLDHLPVSFQLWYIFSNEIAWGKEEGRVVIIADVNGIYASHPKVALCKEKISGSATSYFIWTFKFWHKYILIL